MKVLIATGVPVMLAMCLELCRHKLVSIRRHVGLSNVQQSHDYILQKMI